MVGKKSNASRFPVARIKKLIQADEDVGKVAQATPVVLSKALELFLASLVNECVKDATERGSKKITAYGLKRTITNVATFDFLADVVAGVADPITEEGGDDAPKKTRAKRKPKVKAEGEGGEDGDEGEPKPKRKRAAAKKKEVVAESGEVKEEEGAEQKGSEEEVEEVKPKKGSDEDGGEYDQDEEDDDDE